eukprot:Clim_evm7s8 gene=Clim_evmTU7s8
MGFFAEHFLKLEDWLAVGVILGAPIVAFYVFMEKVRPQTVQAKNTLYSWTMFWLILSGMVHIVIEGAFVFWRDMPYLSPGMDQYGAGDFRYKNPMEPGTWSMEVITAVLDGPLCLMTVYAAVFGLSWRHITQASVCLMQLYGLMWFCLHAIAPQNKEPHMSDDPFLFWVIAVGFNAPWSIVPVILFIDSIKHLNEGMKASLKAGKTA